MNEKNWWKIAVIVIAALALFWGGFYLGRSRDPEVITKTETKYVELPPIHDSIPKPVPYKVVEPVDSMNIIIVPGKERYRLYHESRHRCRFERLGYGKVI